MARREFLARAGGVVAGAALWSPTSAALAARRFPRADDVDATVATAWFDQALDLVRRTPGYSPPVASRAFAYAGMGLYESVVPGIPGFRSLGGVAGGPEALPATGKNTAYDWETVANTSLASILRGLFPTAPAASRAAVDALETSFAEELRAGLRPACSHALTHGVARSPMVSSTGRSRTADTRAT
jgi:hypothetical protein